MHCSTSPSLSPASGMLVSILALFTSICVGAPAAGNITIMPKASLSSGNYTVVAHDTCNIIASSQKVSTNDLIALNCLDLECKHLKANSSIFLPGKCDTYTVKSGDQCKSIVSNHSVTLTDFYAFNPAINRNCSNLVSDTLVCLTAPKGDSIPPPNCPAQSTTSDSSAIIALAPKTDPKCQPLRKAQPDMSCLDLIAPSQDFASFRKLNPSIDADCSNLEPGLQYCVPSPPSPFQPVPS